MTTLKKTGNMGFPTDTGTKADSSFLDTDDEPSLHKPPTNRDYLTKKQ